MQIKNKDNTVLTIGELAEKASVNVETIRFYERKKILNQPIKGLSRRKYTDEFVDQILFIKQAQKVGFTLIEIKELMDLKLLPNKGCGAVKKKTAIKIAEVSQKIENLKEMLKLLKQFESKCDGNELEKCSILDGLKGIKL
jgi:MerR family mercuric resistance operon transcriptional regulator